MVETSWQTIFVLTIFFITTQKPYNKESAKSCGSRDLIGLVGCVFSCVCFLNFLSRWSKLLSRWSNFFLMCQDYLSWMEYVSHGLKCFLVSEKFLLFFFPMVKVLFPWNNPGCFDRPWSDQGVWKVAYLLKLRKISSFKEEVMNVTMESGSHENIISSFDLYCFTQLQVKTS